MDMAISAGNAEEHGRAVVAAPPWSWPQRLLEAPCAALALTGGLVLLGFMAVSVGSIVSRILWGAPLLGDYEIVERGCAVAVFAVLPYCHLKGGNVVVDMFVGLLPRGPRRWLAVANELLFAVIAGLMTWRLAVGGLQLQNYNDQSMMLQIPTWWLFVPIVFSMALLTLVCLARAGAAVSKEDAP